ncbi:MAG: peptide chain release factor N(5)-glutamine methyltransferase [Lachnospiraceae bacterium]|nr:peptide chain release factor N(5)-glutamine methyltransferase [Lachnospiraceae bacterium]
MNRIRRNDAGKALLSGLQGWSFADLLLHLDDPVPESEKERLECAFERLESGEPVQFILNEAPFYGRTFYVDRAVLIPRFDTEILVINAIAVLRSGSGKSVLDLCTGSGAIGITLKKELPELDVTLSDISREALRVAERNARSLNASVKIVNSDLFEDISGSFDLITANPPYIADDVIETLETEVKDHEPRLALSGGSDGLSFYRKMIPGSIKHLNPKGTLLTEIGYDQGGSVRQLFEEAGFKDIEVLKDLAGRDRNVKGMIP